MKLLRHIGNVVVCLFLLAVFLPVALVVLLGALIEQPTWDDQRHDRRIL